MIDRRGKDIYFLDFSFNLFMQYYLFFFGGGVSENKIWNMIKLQIALLT